MDARFEDLLRKWAVAGKPANTYSEYLEFAKAAEVVKGYFKAKARELVTSSAHRPVLYTYGSDGTPLRGMSTFKAEIKAGDATEQVTRRGGEGTEILIERGFVVTRDGLGKIISRPLLRDGTPLSQQKDTWRLVVCAKNFLPHLRVLGHTNICITHVSCDCA